VVKVDESRKSRNEQKQALNHGEEHHSAHHPFSRFTVGQLFSRHTFSSETQEWSKTRKDTRMANDFEKLDRFDRFDIPGFIFPIRKSFPRTCRNYQLLINNCPKRLSGRRVLRVLSGCERAGQDT